MCIRDICGEENDGMQRGKVYGDDIIKRDGNMLRGKKRCGKEICVEKNAENM